MKLYQMVQEFIPTAARQKIIYLFM